MAYDIDTDSRTQWERVEKVQRLEAIKQEMLALAEEALDLVRFNFPDKLRQSQVYWYGHILAALDHESAYGNRYDITLAKVISACDAEVFGTEDED